MRAATREQQTIRILLDKLLQSEEKRFPKPRERLDAPISQGVYVIYSPRGKALHVGRTPRGLGGIRQRLGNHMHGASSFTIQYLKGQGSKLGVGYKFRCLVVEPPRLRALLEAYAIGFLCPAHIGIGDKLLPPPQRG